MIGTFKYKPPTDETPGPAETFPDSEESDKPEPYPGTKDIDGAVKAYPIGTDDRDPGTFRYDVTDDEGLDRTDDPLMDGSLDLPPGGRYPYTDVNSDLNEPSQRLYKAPVQRVITTKFDPRDTNKDGHVDEIEKYQAFMKQTPAERRAIWVDENLHPKGLSVDEETNEIIDPQGNVVGQLPSFG